MGSDSHCAWVTPKKLSTKQRELLQELAKIEGEPVDDGIVDKLKKKFRGKV